MDGFHYYKSKLDQFPDPSQAHKRRGAHWTFDASKFVYALQSAREGGSGDFPSFDHAVGDPVENAIQVTQSNKVVIVEGLYLLLNIPPWDRIKSFLHVCFYLDCPETDLIERLTNRHMETMKLTAADARNRAVFNDIPNSITVIESKDRADIILNAF